MIFALLAQLSARVVVSEFLLVSVEGLYRILSGLTADYPVYGVQ